MGCLFCDIYQREEGIIYENDYFFARFDVFPVTPGHAEVIAKRHVVNLLGLSRKERRVFWPTVEDVLFSINSTDLKEVYQRFIDNPINDKSVELCKEMLEHLGTYRVTMDGFNYGGNEGRAAGRTIDHFHLHLIPRYQGDVENSRGGIRHIIPGKGDYK